MTVAAKVRTWLGLHVCDWTKWEPFEVAVLRAPTSEEFLRGGVMDKMMKETHRWQRRKCKTCGFIQERKL